MDENTVSCDYCGKFVKKWPGQLKKFKNHFCSRSCSATFSNKRKPKRKPEGTCVSCQKRCSTRRKYCNECFEIPDNYKDTGKPLEDLTMGEYRKISRKDAGHYAAIRYQAKALFKNQKCQCKVCGYDKHADVAHIKPLSKFPDEALISEVNAPENLIMLCRNCHWELDRGWLILPPGHDPGTFRLKAECSTS